MKNISIYIHTPFCVSKCNYCNFYSIPIKSNNSLLFDYNNAIQKEIDILTKNYNLYNCEVGSIYFGGGTPSIMPPEFFQNTINHINKNYHINKNAEITVEANPESGGYKKLKALKNIGINRLSVGAQSFNDGVLKFAGRVHKKEDIFKCINNARKCGFDNISIDTIIGLPKQSIEILYDELDILKKISPEHISAYMLSIEEGSIFYNKHNIFINDDAAAQYFAVTVEQFAKSGYIHYEISNFAKQGFESRHNVNYWLRGEYLGFGPSASSFIRLNENYEIRKTNISNLNEYMDNISKSKEPIDYIERLSCKDIINEEIFLSLRTNKGIDTKKLLHYTNREIIENIFKNGFIYYNGDNACLTLKGMLVSNEILSRILI